MTDPRAAKIRDELRERCALRARCDRPDLDTSAWYRSAIAPLRDVLPRRDVLDLDTLAEHLTGVRHQAPGL